MKWQIIIFLVLLMLPIAFATEEEILTYTIGEKVKINTLCSDWNGNLCNASAECNATIYFPDWSLNYSSKNMSYKGVGFFETNLSSYTTEGDYKGFVTCSFGGFNGVSRADFRIRNQSIYGEFTMIALVLIMGGLIGLFLYIGIKGKDFITNIDWLKDFLGFIAVNIALLLIPVSLGMATKIFENSASIAVLNAVYIMSWWVVGAILLVNLIINLWSFIPILWKKTTKLMENW